MTLPKVLLQPPRTRGLQTQTTSCDGGLAGTWEHAGRQYEIANCKYYTRSAPLAWSITPDGNTLTVGPETYARTQASGTQLVGTWLSAAGEELSFKSDLTYIINWGNNDVWFGTYVDSGGSVEFVEYRSGLETDADQLTFNTLYNGEFTYTYALTATTLTLTDAAGSMVYTRIS